MFKYCIDSNVDNWKEKKSVFNERIIRKKKLVFLIEEEDGEKFGYYLNTEVIEQYDCGYLKTDNKSFEFNLESNGRLNHSMKFEIKDSEVSGFILFVKSDDNMIYLRNIMLWKENKKKQSHCRQNEDRFDYHGIEKALCGKERWNHPFTPKEYLLFK